VFVGWLVGSFGVVVNVVGLCRFICSCSVHETNDSVSIEIALFLSLSLCVKARDFWRRLSLLPHWPAGFLLASYALAMAAAATATLRCFLMVGIFVYFEARCYSLPSCSLVSLFSVRFCALGPVSLLVVNGGKTHRERAREGERRGTLLLLLLISYFFYPLVGC